MTKHNKLSNELYDFEILRTICRIVRDKNVDLTQTTE